MDSRVYETKEAFGIALLKLLQTTPLEQITVTELCHEAKLSRGTFYNHYKTTEDVFTNYFQKIIRDLRIHYYKPFHLLRSFTTEQLEAEHIFLFEHVKCYEPFYRIVFSENVPMTYYYDILEQLELLLHDTFITKHARTIDIEFDTAFYANAIIGLMIAWYRHDFEPSVQSMNAQLIRILRLAP